MLTRRKFMLESATLIGTLFGISGCVKKRKVVDGEETKTSAITPAPTKPSQTPAPTVKETETSPSILVIDGNLNDWKKLNASEFIKTQSPDFFKGNKGKIKEIYIGENNGDIVFGLEVNEDISDNYFSSIQFQKKGEDVITINFDPLGNIVNSSGIPLKDIYVIKSGKTIELQIKDGYSRQYISGMYYRERKDYILIGVTVYDSDSKKNMHEAVTKKLDNFSDAFNHLTVEVEPPIPSVEEISTLFLKAVDNGDYSSAFKYTSYMLQINEVVARSYELERAEAQLQLKQSEILNQDYRTYYNNHKYYKAHEKKLEDILVGYFGEAKKNRIDATIVAKEKIIDDSSNKELYKITYKGFDNGKEFISNPSLYISTDDYKIKYLDGKKLFR